LESVSAYQNFGQRFRSNLRARLAAIFIGLAFFIAIFAYFLAPDHTPGANNQIPEIALQAPGFRVAILEVPLARFTEKNNWWQQLWTGQPNGFRSVPLADTKVWQQHDTLFFHRFEKRFTIGRLYHIAIYPVYYGVATAGSICCNDGFCH
jgi:peptide/nickel transport system permease protein